MRAASRHVRGGVYSSRGRGRRLPGDRAGLLEAAGGAGPGRGSLALPGRGSPHPPAAGLGPGRAGLGRWAEVRSPAGWERGPFTAAAEGRQGGRAESPGPVRHGPALPAPRGVEPSRAAAGALISAGSDASESRESTAPVEFTALETERGFFVRCRRFSVIWHQQGSLRRRLTSLCGEPCERVTLSYESTSRRQTMVLLFQYCAPPVNKSNILPGGIVSVPTGTINYYINIMSGMPFMSQPFS